jgi:hypothetical protein
LIYNQPKIVKWSKIKKEMEPEYSSSWRWVNRNSKKMEKVMETKKVMELEKVIEIRSHGRERSEE